MIQTKFQYPNYKLQIITDDQNYNNHIFDYLAAEQVLW